MKSRWRTVRSRLEHDASRADGPGLWNRIAESSRSGKSVELPARDPRRSVSPVLLGVLVLAVIAGTSHVRQAMAPIATDTLAMADNKREDLNALEWLTTPAEAQSSASRLSSLPPIDRLDLARITPRTLAYRFSGGADGETTEQYGIDTIRVARDSAAGKARIIVTYNSMPRKSLAPTSRSYSGVDSLVLSASGSFMFLKSSYYQDSQPQARLERNVLLGRDSITFEGYSQRLGARYSRTFPADFYFFFEDPLVALLPALPFREGYARSLSVLDLLGGETSPAYRRYHEIRVTGQETIKVPAGKFRCWTVEFGRGEPTPFESSSGASVAQPTRLYVDTRTGILVHAFWNESGGFFREQVLVSMQ